MTRIACLTLWEPWASMLFAGVKVHETRSWAPPRALVGQRIAVHAARRAVTLIPELEPLLRAKIPGYPDLPRGALLGTVVIAHAFEISQEVEDATRHVLSGRAGSFGSESGPFNYSDAVAGDWRVGRWAWRVVDPKRFPSPIPARGGQRIWYADLDQALVA